MKFQYNKFINSSICIFGDNNLVKIIIKKFFQAGLKKITLYSTQLYLENFSIAYLKDINFEIFNLLTYESNPFFLESALVNNSLVVDTFENMNHKLEIADACMKVTKPGIFVFKQNYNYQLYPMLAGKSRCLHCLCEAGILLEQAIIKKDNEINALIEDIIASLIVFEIVKLSSNFGITQGNEILQFNFLSGEINTIQGLDKLDDCPDCGFKSAPR